MAFVVKDKVTEPLYAVVPYFNPWRWKSREKHTLRALKHFHDAGVVIILVEAAFGQRELTWADSGLDGTLAECNVLGSKQFKHVYIGLRTKDELWLKENLINVATQAMPYTWTYTCWLDSDIHFTRPNWAGETIHKLQHYKFLQMFSHARDLGPNYELLPETYPHANGMSFITAWQRGNFGQIPPDTYDTGRTWPGLAWAATRQAWDEVGGLLDFAVWGGGDWHMAHALIGERKDMMHSKLSKNYQTMVNSWADKCDRNIRQNVGSMEGSVLHNWHGRKTERGYGDKHRLLAKIGFDPIRHLKRDYQNLYQLHDDGSDTFIQLRNGFRMISHERNEDANETGLNVSSNSH